MQAKARRHAQEYAEKAKTAALSSNVRETSPPKELVDGQIGTPGKIGAPL